MGNKEWREVSMTPYVPWYRTECFEYFEYSYLLVFGCFSECRIVLKCKSSVAKESSKIGMLIFAACYICWLLSFMKTSEVRRCLLEVGMWISLYLKLRHISQTLVQSVLQTRWLKQTCDYFCLLCQIIWSRDRIPNYVLLTMRFWSNCTNLNLNIDALIVINSLKCFDACRNLLNRLPVSREWIFTDANTARCLPSNHAQFFIFLGGSSLPCIINGFG